jgi:putative ABC transport system ATP-binding protein
MSGEVLRVRGLTREFGAGHTLVRAVRDVDLDVARGELALVMGPSGSGKTTLLTMLGALLRPTRGSIVLDGVDIARLPSRGLARIRRERIGFVFQSFNLLDTLTALENVAVALDIAGHHGEQARARARGLLVDAGLGERLAFRARDLSGGEKQRVAIARAIVGSPRLLLADEPTANLDSEHGGEVARLLRDLTAQHGAAAVVVSHDERLVGLADVVYDLRDGVLSRRIAAPDAAAKYAPGAASTPMGGAGGGATMPS